MRSKIVIMVVSLFALLTTIGFAALVSEPNSPPDFHEWVMENSQDLEIDQDANCQIMIDVIIFRKDMEYVERIKGVPEKIQIDHQNDGHVISKIITRATIINSNNDPPGLKQNEINYNKPIRKLKKQMTSILTSQNNLYQIWGLSDKHYLKILRS